MSVNQVVINLKNTREITARGQRFCGEGTHNVKIWYKCFTFSWQLFCATIWFKCLTPMGHFRLCWLGLTRVLAWLNPLDTHFCGLQRGTKKARPTKERAQTKNVFDESLMRLKQITTSDQQLQEPYQPRCLRTSWSSSRSERPSP